MPRDEQVTAVTDVTKQPVSPHHATDCLVVIYSEKKAMLGRRFRLTAGPIRLGRELDNEVVLDEQSVSRRHARIERSGDHWLLMDVGSSNGTLLNGSALEGGATLKGDDKIKVGSTILKYLSGSDVENAFHEEIYQLTITDHLTTLRNRRAFHDVLEREFSRARRYRRELSVLLLDLDRFKRINDELGHAVGDSVLASVAQTLKNSLPGDEVVARFGGEEFAVVLPETGIEHARAQGELLRSAVAANPYEQQGVEIAVTVSVGCASLLPDDKSASDLVQRADELLYSAKSSGRNRVSS